MNRMERAALAGTTRSGGRAALRLALAAAAALGLAACSNNGMSQGSSAMPAASMPAQAPGPGMTTGTVSANPPDRQTGSQGYQSPDLAGPTSQLPGHGASGRHQ